jgi:transcription termination/antitermination protein NusG
VIGLEEDAALFSPIPRAVSDPDCKSFWYALYTRSRHEQLVKKQLDHKGIVNFLPLYAKMSQWKDRKKEIRLPLFPGYVFVKIVVQERMEVLKSFGAVHIVGDGCTPLPIEDEQIENMRSFVERGLRCNPHPYLAVGNRVRIHDGPLRGFEGILIRMKNRDRFVLSVDLIQRSISVEIDCSKIEGLNCLSNN